MKAKIIFLSALVGLLAACGRRGGAPGSPPQRKVLFYRAPMDRNMTSPVPAKDSMGMDYVPVYADEQKAPESGAFSVSEMRRQEIGVKFSVAERRPFVKTIRTVGRIAYDPELYRTQEEYLAALSSSREAQESSLPDSGPRAKSLLESSRLRLRLQGLSDAQIDALGESGKPDAGLLLSPGKGGSLWLYAEVFESDLPVVRVGQEAEASTPSLPGEIFRGVIAAIDPVLNPKTRSARVRIRIVDPRGLLRPDMYLNAAIDLNLGERLAVPREAVVDTGTRQVVFVDLGNGFLAARPVSLGERTDDLVEIRDGLKAGDRVVTSGNFLIDSESNLKAALAGFPDVNQH
ncbi:MAG TPA: efflux RND transporter periplasmic adaptor subunit [Elusimicrobiota bacterium]|nr:efflux RND transporter periplasmic adaptor subunit [Elusimicrobiota bacterium]